MDYSEIRKLKKNKYGAFMGIGLYNKKDHPKVYSIWQQMIYRVYSDSNSKKPTYLECKVSDEWLCFQNFAEWYYNNYPKDDNYNYHLDKDILFKGNKLYSSKTCVFIPQEINKLFTNRKLHRGSLPIGINVPKTYEDKKVKKYSAYCSDGYGKIIRGKVRVSMKEAFNDYVLMKKKVIREQAERFKNVLSIEVYNAIIDYEIIDDTSYQLHLEVNNETS